MNNSAAISAFNAAVDEGRFRQASEAKINDRLARIERLLVLMNLHDPSMEHMAEIRNLLNAFKGPQ